MKKVIVKVETSEDENGWILPKALTWIDGTRYEIQSVSHYAKAVDHEYEGIRYTVYIDGEEKYLFRTDNDWYVIQKGGK